MKRISILVMCFFIGACSSSAVQNSSNSNQEILVEPARTMTQIIVPSITPTMAVTPTSLPIFIGNDSGLLSFLAGSQINIIDFDGDDLLLINRVIGNVSISGNPPYAWSPNGSYIAFITLVDGNPVLKLIDVLTSDVNDISQDDQKLNVGSFAWHPDGNKILVSTEGGPNSKSEIWIIDLNYLTIHKIDVDHEYSSYQDLAWSPDGNKFSFKYWANDGEELYYSSAVLNISGEIEFSPETKYMSITWSPLGNIIGIDKIQSFEIINLDTNEGIELINVEDEPKILGNVTWSPDGNYLAYILNEGPFGRGINFYNTSVHIYDFAENKNVQIMDTQIMYSNLTWSPSGDQLGYTLCDEYQCSIRRVDKNGNKVFDVVYLDPGVSSVYWTYTPLKIHPQVMSTPATP